MDCETWKDIEGYKGLYQVSSLGCIKSFPKYRKKISTILKPHQKTDGYLLVCLYKSNIRKDFYIHRLVLTTFIGPPPAGMICRHLNSIKTDNRLCNLKWGTYIENNGTDKIKHGTNLVGSKNHQSKLTEKDVKKIKKLLRQGRFKQIEIARIFNVTATLISLIKQDKIWKHVQ